MNDEGRNSDMIASKPQKGQVFTELEHFFSGVEHLSQLTEELEKILSPICIGKMCFPPKPGETEQSLCDLAERIRVNRRNLESVIDKLKFIKDAIQI